MSETQEKTTVATGSWTEWEPSARPVRAGWLPVVTTRAARARAADELEDAQATAGRYQVWYEEQRRRADREQAFADCVERELEQQLADSRRELADRQSEVVRLQESAVEMLRERDTARAEVAEAHRWVERMIAAQAGLAGEHDLVVVLRYGRPVGVYQSTSEAQAAVDAVRSENGSWTDGTRSDDLTTRSWATRGLGWWLREQSGPETWPLLMRIVLGQLAGVELTTRQHWGERQHWVEN